MAKISKTASKSGKSAEEKQMVERLSDMLRAATFETQHQLDLERQGYPDLVAGREYLGAYHRYAIEVVYVRDASSLVSSFAQLQDYASRRKSDEFDEYWLVSNLSYPERPSRRIPRYQNVRTFTMKELDRLLGRSTPKRRSAPKTGKARTVIGKAIEANETEINLAIAGLILQIDAKTEALRGERPNSSEAIAERDAHISEYERMRAELERIRDMVAAFKSGAEKEATVVKSVTTFREGIQNWWHKGQDQIIGKTFDSALFLSSVGLLSLTKADMKTGMIIVGSLIAGKTVAGALKKLPKKLPWSGG